MTSTTSTAVQGEQRGLLKLGFCQFPSSAFFFFHFKSVFISSQITLLSMPWAAAHVCRATQPGQRRSVPFKDLIVTPHRPHLIPWNNGPLCRPQGLPAPAHGWQREPCAVSLRSVHECPEVLFGPGFCKGTPQLVGFLWSCLVRFGSRTPSKLRSQMSRSPGQVEGTGGVGEGIV